MQRFNWSKNLCLDASSTVTPQSIADVQACIHDARNAGSVIRPIGSLHSYSPLVLGADVLIDLSAFLGVTLLPNNLARVGAGVTLDALIEVLRSEGFMLPIMGEITEQTIAGATATCTHGGSMTWGVLSDLIVAVELVDARARHRRITNADPEFPAVCMSLGLLGVITAFEIRVEPLRCYHMHKQVSHVKQWLPTWLKQSQQHTYYQLDWFSHTDIATVKMVDSCDSCNKCSHADTGAVQSFLKALHQCHEQAYNNLEVSIKQQQQLVDGLESEQYCHNLDKLITVVHTERMVTSEFFVRVDQAEEVVQKLQAYKWSQPVLFSLRPVPQDLLWLSPGYQQDCIAIACVVFSVQHFMPTVLIEFNRLMRTYHARPHWAKLCQFAQLDLHSLFPKMSAFIALRQSQDPSGIFYSCALRDLLESDNCS